MSSGATEKTFVCEQAPCAWKTQLQSLLPVFFDTKYLLTSKMKDAVRDSSLEPALRALERRAAAVQSAAAAALAEEAAPEDVDAGDAPPEAVVPPSLTFPLAPGFQWKQTALPAAAAVAVPADGEAAGAPPVDAVVTESAATGSAHDSGFDAFMTGSLFVRCLQHLGYSREELVEVAGYFRAVRASSAVSPDTPFVYALSDHAIQLKKLANVIAAARCTPPEWNLAPDAPAPRRPPSKAYMLWISNVSAVLTNDDVVVCPPCALMGCLLLFTCVFAVAATGRFGGGLWCD